MRTRFLIILITIASITMLSTSTTFASDDWKNFTDKWEFTCKKEKYGYVHKNPQTTANLTSYLKTIFIEAYHQGFERLLKINPEFISKLLEKIDSENLDVYCDRLDGPFGETTYYPFERTKIYLSSAVLSVYISNLETNKLLQDAIDNETDPGLINLYKSMMRDDPVSRIVVVHELLHFMRADNIPRLIHNNPEKSDPNDIVFACANAAFKSITPDEIGPDEIDPDEADKKSCEKCARARVINGRNIVSKDPADIKSAQKICAELI